MLISKQYMQNVVECVVDNPPEFTSSNHGNVHESDTNILSLEKRVNRKKTSSANDFELDVPISVLKTRKQRKKKQLAAEETAVTLVEKEAESAADTAIEKAADNQVDQ
ncbi:hypothetical protein HAX54_018228 [Datura stramonium]|uniref:Uncharacterized protein n=1 Tax=Datura stramonium TaxID=4076 RepID=A0ABS8UMP0_DATST|nr:hypothetical protein [Datura stramonium]